MRVGKRRIKLTIFDAFKKFAVSSNADYIRTVCATEMRERIRKAIDEAYKGDAKDAKDDAIETWVNNLLHVISSAAVDVAGSYVAELQDGSEDSQRAINQLVQGSVFTAQFFQKTVMDALRPIILNMKLRCADYAASAVSEALVAKGVGLKEIGPGDDTTA